MLWIIAASLLGATVDLGSVDTITSGGKTRKYIVYDPGATATPKRVILAFHGIGHSARDLETDTKLNEFAKAKGYVVAYPMSAGLAWNAGNCCGSEKDLEFVDDLLVKLRPRSDLDAKKVFVAGMSNGGMMAYRLAAERPDDVAAIAVVAGSMESTPAKKVPVPVLHIHGTLDGIVKFDGSRSERFDPSLSTQDTIDAWVAINGCQKPPAQTQLSATPMPVTRDDYTPGSSKAEVVLITVAGGGHLWPGVTSPTFPPALLPKLGQTNNNISATSIIGEFFEANR
jgi:polyhydroxybutyrate depolymerase